MSTDLDDRHADAFAVLGTTRGSDRPGPAESEELDDPARRRRLLLATVAAHGILSHNSAVEMPGDFTAASIAWILAGADPQLPYSDWPPVTDELAGDLRTLVSVGYLSLWKDRYKVTRKGLTALWMGIVA